MKKMQKHKTLAHKLQKKKKKKKKRKKKKNSAPENTIRFKGRQKQHITTNKIRIIF